MSVQISSFHNIKPETKKKCLLLSIIAIFFIIIAAPGCSSSQRLPDLSSETGSKLVNTGNEISGLGSGIEKSANTIQARSDDIKSDTEGILKIDPVDPKVKELTNNIQQNNLVISSEAEKIRNDAKATKEKASAVIASGTHVQNLETDLDAANDEGTKEARKKLYQLMAGMFAVGGLIIIGGIALAFFNPRMGAYLAGFGLIITTVAVAGTYYLQWIAIVGFVLIGLGLIATLAFLIYSFMKAKVYKQSHESNVELLETVKKDLLPDEKEKIFGDNGIAKQIQPPKVQKEIKKTREVIKANTE